MFQEFVARYLYNMHANCEAACSDATSESGHCHIIEGALYLKHRRDEDLLNLEELYGPLILTNSEMETLPKMPKLRKIELVETSEDPVINITNNSNLKSIAELIHVENIVVGGGNHGVEIRDNPKLCIETKYMQTKFVMQYANHIRECGAQTREVSNRDTGEKGGMQNSNSVESPPPARMFPLHHFGC
ncbi:receptor L domain protein [Ancylostoma caninum]|uniref:Receptor L domain protein n=1 Tax=Ancylostoma caninum TaxID=29170 RepID=A0A368GAN2_ANCCA|nr:receptor L domain protein [Ancylostoma caninum]